MVDLETGGLDPQKHEVLEIGVVTFDSETFEIISTFESRARAYYPEKVSPEAARVNGYNEEEWKSAPTLYEAMCKLAPLTRDACFASHNVCFDWSFFEKARESTLTPFTFSYRKLDLYSLAWAKLPHDKVQKWSLKGLCEYLGIEPEPEIHSALNGAMKAYEVYKKLMEN